jgi:MFS family permease
VTVTVIFGVYAVAVLASLLVFGSLSDHIRRRPVLVTALLAQTLVMLVFATASGLDVLLLSRVLQGLATGAALGVIGAGLVDIHGARASLRPTLAVPTQVRSALLIATPSLVAVWALAGFYGSLGPSLTELVSHPEPHLAMGLPTMLAGFLVVHSTVTRTAEEFGAAVILLAALTAAGLLRSGRRGRNTGAQPVCAAA